MNSYTPGTYKLPEPKRTRRRGGGLKASMEMLAAGQCKFVSTQKIPTVKKQRSATAAMHTTAKSLGIKITTYTSVDDRIVAQLKEGSK